MTEFNSSVLVEFIDKAFNVSPLRDKLSWEDEYYAREFEKKYTFESLKVRASVGKTKSATHVPYIGFLYEGQKITNGIYPCFLFYKRYKILYLVYCFSATNIPDKSWGSLSTSTIKEDLASRVIKAEKKAEKDYQNCHIFARYDLTFNADGELDTSCFDAEKAISDLKSIIMEYKGIFEGHASYSAPEDEPHEEMYVGDDSGSSTGDPTLGYFDMRELCKAIGASKLIYRPNLIRRFVCALMTKPFVILSGLAGSGKTQLVRAFAYSICEDIRSQFLLVPVGADWTNRDPLLGYPNALKETDYCKDDYGVVDLILRAQDNPHRPYFLVLDEMNMSYVERYFSDFLSAMESGEPISLWKNPNPEDKKNPPSSIARLPKNLFIIGTINVDETTYMFSPKVLDRASVIEFKVEADEMEEFLSRSEDDGKSSAEMCLGLAKHLAGAFLRESTENSVSKREDVNKTLMDFFNQLKNLNAEFGYRSAVEIYKYIGNFVKYPLSDDETPDRLLVYAVDSAIVQKILPKLHGSQRRLKPILDELWKFCFFTEPTSLDNISEGNEPSDIKYPLAANKIKRMYNSARNNGFTSFAEA